MNIHDPYISICIPAYERAKYLKRLLDSVCIQKYKNYEVIITDDSTTSEVEYLIEEYKHKIPLKYIRNQSSLGSPANWNKSIEVASYEWIKIMHDDDYFYSTTSLTKYANSISKNPNVKFFFSSFIKTDEVKGSQTLENINLINKLMLKCDPLILFKKNYIGHPSTTIYRKDKLIEFDKRFKWVVDIEFYIRYLNKHKEFIYIKEPLVCVSVNDTQITKSVFRVKEIEVPENHQFLEKIGTNCLKNIFVYDHFWRLYRNLEIRNWSEISRFNITYNHKLSNIIRFQNCTGQTYLRIGVVSKILMSIHFLISSFKK